MVFCLLKSLLPIDSSLKEDKFNVLKKMKKILKQSWAFILFQYCVLLNSQLNIIVIGFFMPVEIVGKFKIIFQLSTITALALNSVNKIITPQISNAFQSKNLNKIEYISLETNKKNGSISSFGKQLSMHIAASNPLALEASLIDKDILDKELELVNEELKNSGKPDEIAKKISLGKMNKFKEENALLTQAWVMEPKKKVKDIIKELSIHDLKIREFSRVKIGE